jgi:WD40 repeat protein
MNNPYLVCCDLDDLHEYSIQLMQSECWDEVNSLLHDVEFMEAKASQLGVDELLQDYVMALHLLPEEEDWRNKLATTKRVLDRQAHYLRGWSANANKPASFFLQQFRNCALELGYSDLQNLAEIRLSDAKLPYLCERFPVSRESKALMRTLEGHTEVVDDVAITADGRWAVSASYDNTLIVWDLTTGQKIRTLEGHTDGVNGVAVTADGCWAVSGSWDKTLKVWDLMTGQAILTFIGQTNAVNDVAITSDRRWVVSAAGQVLRVWDLTKEKAVHTLRGHRDYVNAVAITDDGHWAVSASDDHTLKIWDLMTGKAVRTLRADIYGAVYGIKGVAVTGDGLWAVFTVENNLKIWDLTTGRVVRTLEGHTDAVNGVAVTGEGHWAVSASRDKTLKVWDITTGQAVRTLEGHSDAVNCVAATGDGRWAISAGANTVKLWDISEFTLSDDEGPNSNLTKGKAVRTLEGHKYSVNGVVITSDGHWAVSASDDYTLKVWDLTTGQAVRTLEGHTSVDSLDSMLLGGYRGMLYGLAVTGDGRWAVSASVDKTLKVWDLTTGQAVRALEGHKDMVNDVAVSADGRWAVSASSDRTLKVWDLANGQAVRTLERHTGAVFGVAMTADGRWVVSASKDRTLIVWDLKTGQAIRTLKRHTDEVNGVAVTADGRWAISASWDKTLKVWDLTTGQAILSLPSTGHILCCAIAPDNQTIVAGDDAGAVHFVEWVKY